MCIRTFVAAVVVSTAVVVGEDVRTETDYIVAGRAAAEASLSYLSRKLPPEAPPANALREANGIPRPTEAERLAAASICTNALLRPDVSNGADLLPDCSSIIATAVRYISGSTFDGIGRKQAGFLAGCWSIVPGMDSRTIGLYAGTTFAALRAIWERGETASTRRMAHLAVSFGVLEALERRRELPYREAMAAVTCTWAAVRNGI